MLLSSEFSVIKEIDQEIYVGGKNFLAKYKDNGEKLNQIKKQYYFWDKHIMNGSDIGFKYIINHWPGNFARGPSSYAFDSCLNWKEEHEDATVRNGAFDYQHWKYHTSSGDWLTMNYTCKNSFIKSIEKLDENTLWVCATFGAFPRAFSVNKDSLEFLQFVDVNMMSCARYEDEPMVTYRDKLKNLYVASGWGLYRPDNKNPDVPDNNSTMLYADWRLYRNLFTLPSSMAWVLSSDVNFINVVKDTNEHLYFFGQEINNQYGLNNQDDRNSWQSFMIRICKNDLGFKYIPVEHGANLKSGTSGDYFMGRFNPPMVSNAEDFMVSPRHDHIDYNKSWYDDTVHLPKKHFVTPLKVNFGCYIGKRPRAISDNHYWGDTNVIYINKLADVIFDPNRKIQYSTKSNDEVFGCVGKLHEQIPLMGVFNREGLSKTNVEPSGALCQLQINANIFNEIGTKKEIYNKHNIFGSKSAYDEIMSISSTSYSNFYSRTIHRTNGFTLAPYWNQGVLIGSPDLSQFADVGKCQDESFYNQLKSVKFLQIQNSSNLAWPNELPNKFSSIPSTFCQYSAAELYSFNASFVMKGVQFKKLFLLKENIIDYHMQDISGVQMRTADRLKFSPLMIVNIISTHGHLYRVVLCDFDNSMLNHGENKSSDEWYNWCIFRYTDQPYLYRQYTPMEDRKRGQSFQFRASSLLLDKKIVNDTEDLLFPVNRDPQIHVVKDVLRKGNYLHVLTTENIYTVNTVIDCTQEYTTCIECASDPDCMWNNKKKKCMAYNKSQYEKQSMVQDVLDRGFKCAQFISVTIYKNIDIGKTINDFQMPLTVQCINWGFWRGKIQWKINNETVITRTSKQYIISENQEYLTILPKKQVIKSITCLGLKVDKDKLYGDIDYHVTDIDSKILSVYNHAKDSSNSCVIAVSILTFILIIALILLGLLVYRKLKRKPKSQNSTDPHDSRSTETETILRAPETAKLKSSTINSESQAI